MSWEQEFAQSLDESSRPWEAQFVHYVINEAQWQDLDASESDIARSLHSLVKNNKGLFKSEAQGKFMHGKIRTTPLLKDSMAASQAKRFVPTFDPKTHTAVEITQRLGQFGRTNQSKIRYSAFAFILDGFGVVARIKLKVKVKPDQPKFGQVDYSSADVNFKRSETPPENSPFFDITGDATKKKKEKDAKVKKNQPKIDQIKKVKSWEQNSFLRDMVKKLEDGQTLTPNMTGAVDRILMKAGIAGMGHDWELWQSALDAIEKWMRGECKKKAEDLYIRGINADIDALKPDKNPLGNFGMDAEARAERKKALEARKPLFKKTYDRAVNTLFKGKYPPYDAKPPKWRGAGTYSTFMYGEWEVGRTFVDKGLKNIPGDWDYAIVEVAKAIDKARRKVRVTKEMTQLAYGLIQFAKKLGWQEPK